MRLNNDFKIKFVNAMVDLSRHRYDCSTCAIYIRSAHGDLCDEGKDIIAKHLAYADLHLDLKALEAQGK